VVRPQGNRGEVAAEIHTDFPEKFSQRRRLFGLADDGRRRELHLQECWSHKGRMILKFAGVDSISQAEELVGAEIQIPASERAPLEPGSAYVADLIGCTLLAAHHSSEAYGKPAFREIGRVTDVQFGAGEAPLLVVRSEPAGREYLVPFAEAYLQSVDTAARQILMVLPEGMLDLDAPLSPEEKQRQARGE
jgi:16S rRNA processing protein RimM